MSVPGTAVTVSSVSSTRRSEGKKTETLVLAVLLSVAVSLLWCLVTLAVESSVVPAVSFTVAVMTRVLVAQAARLKSPDASGGVVIIIVG